MKEAGHVYAAYRSQKGKDQLIGVGDSPEAGRHICERDAFRRGAGSIAWQVISWQDQGEAGGVVWYTKRLSVWSAP